MQAMTKKPTTLKGLGPTSMYQLKAIGINSKEDLQSLGAIPTYLKLKKHYKNISLNFLYAMVGVLEDKHWRVIAATQREQLLLQIDGYAKLAASSGSTPASDN